MMKIPEGITAESLSLYLQKVKEAIEAEAMKPDNGPALYMSYETYKMLENMTEEEYKAALEKGRLNIVDKGE